MSTKVEPLTLWAESDDLLLPPPGQRVANTPREEHARLIRKCQDIEECIAASVDTLSRHRARLNRLESEIEYFEHAICAGKTAS